MKELEATRARLGADLEELEGRLPAAVSVVKRVGAALAGVGAAGVATRIFLRRRRRSKGDDRYRDLEKRLSRLERRVD
jgi:hypothetical protein